MRMLEVQNITETGCTENPAGAKMRRGRARRRDPNLFLYGMKEGRQKSMSPMPPPGGIIGAFFSGASATMASVVIIRPAMEAAP